MGVDLATYRGRIGTNRHSCGQDVITVRCVINFSSGLKTVGAVLFIGVLLLIAGIESNPGPDVTLSTIIFISIVIMVIGMLIQIMEWKILVFDMMCFLFVGGLFSYGRRHTTRKETKFKVSNTVSSERIPQKRHPTDQDVDQTTPKAVKTSPAKSEDSNSPGNKDTHQVPPSTGQTLQYSVSSSGNTSESSENIDNEGNQLVLSPQVTQLHHYIPKKTFYEQYEEEENFLRITRLIIKCGMPLLRCFISHKAQVVGKVIDVILKSYESEVKCLLHKAQKVIVFPENGKTDLELWDFSTLTVVLLVAFKPFLRSDEKKAIKKIMRIRKKVFTHTITLSLNDHSYLRQRIDIGEAFETLLYMLASSEKDRFMTIINECKKGSIGIRGLIKEIIESELWQIRAEEENFLRMTSLILKCGLPLLRRFISHKEHEGGEVIDDTLERYKTRLKCQLHKAQKVIVFPENGKTDLEMWDLSTLSVVFLVAFNASLTSVEKHAIRTINDIRSDLVAHTITPSLNDHKYQNYRRLIEEAFKTLLHRLAISEQDNFMTIINECKSVSIGLRGQIKEIIEPEFRQFRAEPSQTQYEIPTISRPHDGRLIVLEKKEVSGLLANCEERIIQGGFGKIHISNAEVPGLDIRVVIKKIVPDSEGATIEMLSISNEKIASRVMHFAIVPLIAYMEESLAENKRAFYFISPYLKGGNLFELISKDNEKDKTAKNDFQLKQNKRVEILFQIASALEYLHTPVRKTRGKILHMDLTTQNIVLDKDFNARLIDFGLAREMNEGQSEVHTRKSHICGTVGYHPTTRYSLLTVHEDYYNFGIVIRELLTGRKPYIKQEGGEVFELRNTKEDLIKRRIQDGIWTNGSDEDPVKTLATLSTICLSREENLSSTRIIKTLTELHNHPNTRPIKDNCQICIVNVAVSGVNSLRHKCRMKVCVSCMRNSHINPIKCPQCNKCVEPEIGHTYAALLIAGNDLENVDLAKSFKENVEEMKEVLVSKWPCVIGIRDENVMTVTPSVPGKSEQLLPRLSEAINMLESRKGLGTLLLYFTGHYYKESGFKLGNQEDMMTLKKLKEDLKIVSKAWENQENTSERTARILVFLDCCNPPGVIPDLSNNDIKVIQLNVCRSNEICRQPISGSTFQKFFIQALTRRSYNKQCHNVGHDKPEKDECKDCEMSGDFITVESLLKYISDHMTNSLFGKQPFKRANEHDYQDTIVGYNVDFAFDINVKFKGPNKTKGFKLSPKIIPHITDLKKNILEEIAIDHEMSHVGLTPSEFSDAVALRIHIGGQELETMEEVYLAMTGKREIIASYRTESNILNGRVVLFGPTEVFYQYIDKGLIEFKEKGMKEATLSLPDLQRVSKEIKGNADLGNLHDTLLTVEDKWRNKKQNTNDKKLKIIFPCINGDKFHDFMVLDLQELPENHSK